MQAALQRALARSGVPADKQAECERCFDDVCYSPDPETVVNRLAEIAGISAYMEGYVNGELRPTVERFTEAFRGKAFTAKCKASSYSESANAQVKKKIAKGVHTFWQIVTAILASFYLKKKGEITNLARMRHPIGGSEWPATIGPWLRGELQRILAEASDCEIQRQVAESPWLVVKHRRQYTVTPSSCSCNTMTASGIPCAEITALFLAPKREFPFHLISQRWLQTEAEGAAQSIGPSEAEIVANINSVLSMSVVDLEESAAHDNSDGEVIEEHVAVEVEAAKKKTTFYSEMMQITKQLVVAADQLPASDQNKFRETLTEMLHRIRPSVEDIGDAMRVKPGRPGPQGHSQPVKHRAVMCPICAQDHPLADCPGYGIFCEEKDAYAPKAVGKRVCTLCDLAGHSRSKCPVQAATLKQMLRK
jgi:hypothetical protein